MAGDGQSREVELEGVVGVELAGARQLRQGRR